MYTSHGPYFKTEKLSHEMYLHISDDTDLSDNKILRIAQITRSYEGKECIEANLREALKEYGERGAEFFSVHEETFDIHYTEKLPDGKKITRTEREQRNVVFCNDHEGWIKFVKAERGIDEKEELREQFGIDGGGDHFKITGNLVEVKLKPGAPTNPKHIKRRHKFSSVKALYLLAIVEGHISSNLINSE